MQKAGAAKILASDRIHHPSPPKMENPDFVDQKPDSFSLGKTPPTSTPRYWQNEPLVDQLATQLLATPSQSLQILKSRVIYAIYEIYGAGKMSKEPHPTAGRPAPETAKTTCLMTNKRPQIFICPVVHPPPKITPIFLKPCNQ